MEIREGIPRDKRSIEELWKYCFNDGESFQEYYFNKVYQPENTIVAIDSLEQELIGALQLNPYILHYNKKNWKVSYVVGVSVAPWSRGAGVMKPLMSEALQKCYQKGEALSILMPIDDRLYSRYGFRYTYQLMEYVMKTNSLPRVRFNGQIRPIRQEDIEEVAEVYQDAMSNYEGYSVRNKFMMEKFIEEVKAEQGYLYGVYQESILKGYFAYYLMEDTIYVREVFYENIEVLKGILTFFYHHNTQKPKIKFQTPQGSLLPHIIENMREVEVSAKPFMMSRIINVKKFFEQSSWNQIAKGILKLRVVDEDIIENNGTHFLEFKEGKCEVIKGEESQYNIEIDIGTLTQYFIGDLSIDEAIQLNKIRKLTVEEKELFTLLKTKSIKYINEYI